MANATPADAEVILKLYDLRRESEMRKARDYIAEFWPERIEDVIAKSKSCADSLSRPTF